MRPATVLALALLVSTGAAAPAPAASWRLARGPSEVTFRVGHLIFMEVEGRFRRFSGSIRTAGAGFDGAVVEAAIEVGSVTTGHRDRDRELLGEEFFAAERYPTIRFASSSVRRRPGGGYRVRGELTIRDVTREIVFDAQELERRPARHGERVVLSATTTLNRYDFGLRWNDTWSGRALVSETVEISIRAALDPMPRPAPARR